MWYLKIEYLLLVCVMVMSGCIFDKEESGDIEVTYMIPLQGVDGQAQIDSIVVYVITENNKVLIDKTYSQFELENIINSGSAESKFPIVFTYRKGLEVDVRYQVYSGGRIILSAEDGLSANVNNDVVEVPIINSSALEIVSTLSSTGGSSSEGALSSSTVGSSSQGVLSSSSALNNQKEVMLATTGIVGQDIEINSDDHTVTVNLPYGTLLNALTFTMNYSEGATLQFPLPNEFSYNSPVVFTLIAENVTKQDWQLTFVELLRAGANITGFEIPDQATVAVIDTSLNSVTVTYPYGMDITTLFPVFTLSEGATQSTIGSDFTDSIGLTVHAENGIWDKSWMIYMVEGKNSDAKILLVEISDQPAAITIEDGAQMVSIVLDYGVLRDDLTILYTLSPGATMPQIGTDYGVEKVVTVTAADGSTQEQWTIMVTNEQNSEAEVVAISVSGETSSAVIDQANDRVTLEVPYGTDLLSLNPTISVSADATFSFDVDESTFEVTLQVIAQNDTIRVWIVIVNYAANTEAEIVDIDFGGITPISKTINPDDNTVGVVIPYGTVLNPITPTVSLSYGATIASFGANFSSPVMVTVVSEDGLTTESWSIDVSVAQNSAANIESFSIVGQTGSSTIDASSRDIYIELAYGTSVSSTSVTIGVSDGASYVEPANYLDTDAIISVQSEDGALVQDWLLHISFAQNSAAVISGMSFSGQTGNEVIDTNSLSVTGLLSGVFTLMVAPTFTLSFGATLSPTSGSMQDFTGGSRTYSVTSEDGNTTRNFAVSIRYPFTATEITNVSIGSLGGSDSIHSIGGVFNYYSVFLQAVETADITNVIPSITLSQGATSNPAVGAAVNLDNGALEYVVTAEDGVTQKNWNVVVHRTLYDSRDGKFYKFIKIGTQYWMAENLNYTAGGTLQSWCYNDIETNCDIYGRFYRWVDIMDTALSVPLDTICPSGWHVSTDDDWKTLESYAGMSSSELDSLYGYRGTSAGIGSDLKYKYDWYSIGAVDTNATDKYGLSVRSTGWWDGAMMMWMSLNYQTYIWTSSRVTSGGIEYPVIRIFYATIEGIYRGTSGNFGRANVRCVMD